MLANNVELKQLNEKLESAHTQLLQSEKMASIGQLAAGVAHEINNPVGFVNSNLGTLGKYITSMFNVIAAYETAEAKSRSPIHVRKWPRSRRQWISITSRKTFPVC